MYDLLNIGFSCNGIDHEAYTTWGCKTQDADEWYQLQWNTKTILYFILLLLVIVDLHMQIE